MAGLTEAQKRSFIRQIIEIMHVNAATLKAQGLDVTAKLADLKTKSDGAERSEEEQLKAQADAKAKTTVARNALRAAYDLASAQADAITGSLGKKDPMSQKIKNMRDAMTNETLRGRKKNKDKKE